MFLTVILDEKQIFFAWSVDKNLEASIFKSIEAIQSPSLIEERTDPIILNHESNMNPFSGDKS